MFNQPLALGEKRVPPSTPVVEDKVYTPEETSITFTREERKDISYAGYRAYLYHFTCKSEVQDKEVYECIISAATIDEAIATFVATEVRNEDWYVDAEYHVEIIGVDLKPDRESKWVMALS